MNARRINAQGSDDETEPVRHTLLSAYLTSTSQSLYNHYIRVAVTCDCHRAPKATTQSGLSPVTPNSERAILVCFPSRTRLHHCSLVKSLLCLRSRSSDSYKCGPQPVQILVAVPTGVRRSCASAYTERVKVAPYNRKPGWVGHASSSFDRCGIQVSFACLLSPANLRD